jgi:hypothetical protein
MQYLDAKRIEKDMQRAGIRCCVRRALLYPDSAWHHATADFSIQIYHTHQPTLGNPIMTEFVDADTDWRAETVCCTPFKIA